MADRAERGGADQAPAQVAVWTRSDALLARALAAGALATAMGLFARLVLTGA